MNLYIVESPLQVICAYESILENKEKNYDFYIRLTGRGKNDLHTICCAEFFNIRYKTFKFSPNSLKLDFILNIGLWVKFIFLKRDAVYFGSIFSKTLNFIKNIIKYNEIVYLDDGAATLKAYDLMFKKDFKENLDNIFVSY